MKLFNPTFLEREKFPESMDGFSMYDVFDYSEQTPLSHKIFNDDCYGNWDKFTIRIKEEFGKAKVNELFNKDLDELINEL